LVGEAVKIDANSIWVFDLKSGQRTYSGETFYFDFNNQHKESYDEVVSAFEAAVDKRAKDGCFIGLSSGYDSGAIAARLLLLPVEWKAFSILGVETRSVLEERLKLVPGELVHYTRADYERTRNFAIENAEPYTYNFVFRGKAITSPMLVDGAVPGLSAICEGAKSEGRKVYLSGQGADEIIGDYILTKDSSCFRGNWPKELKPWINFFKGTQDGFINKEENVAGAYGIETRYPFLDTKLVQEWLWLSVNKKRERYKGPIRKYLEDTNFPFAPGVKMGFKSEHNLWRVKE
jgi:asparagine synthetase B (glutamine-hydrolysing)